MCQKRTFKETLVPLELPRHCVRGTGKAAPRIPATQLCSFAVSAQICSWQCHTQGLFMSSALTGKEGGDSQKFLKSLCSQHFTSYPVSKTLNLNVTLLIPSYIIIHCRAKEAILIFVGKEWKNALRADCLRDNKGFPNQMPFPRLAEQSWQQGGSRAAADV